MKTIIISGGSGTIGKYLSPQLKAQGWTVRILSRNEEKCRNNPDFIHWNPKKGIIDPEYLEADVVVNLAGAGIADGRWTNKRKNEILSSRIDSTRLLIEAAGKKSRKLEAFISASAIGYYGDGGNRLLTEESGVITNEFLSEVCMAWEEEAAKASDVSEQVSIIRIGTVLSPEGGALEKMDVTIPYGVANYLGSGKQFMSWIHISDVCGIIMHLIKNQKSGIYNAVAPEVHTNKSFTEVLKNAINRFAVLLPAPALGIKLMFGEMARVVLNSSKVSAEKIIESGYEFIFPDLETALKDLYD